MSTTAKDLIFDAPLFRELEDVDRQRLGEITSVKQFSRGEEIFREGSPPEFSYLIVTGRVKIFKITPAGRDIILELFSAGDLFGAIAAYRGIPYPASAAALEDATLLQVPQKKFFMLLEQHPSLVRGLLLSLTQRVVQLTNRFARLFLKLADEVGKSGPEGQVVPLALSRQELADMTGTTIETCIRLMSRWSKEGIVRTEKDGFVLLDRKTLEQVSLD